MQPSIFDTIKKTIDHNDIVLFMKGNAQMPQCGFSAMVVQVLKNLNVSFLDINVLEDSEIRDGIKQFTNWPTIPQLYIKGEFIGGCDIVKEMYQAGELQDVLREKNIQFQDAA
jgi:monothiol glutaredoxin